MCGLVTKGLHSWKTYVWDYDKGASQLENVCVGLVTKGLHSLKTYVWACDQGASQLENVCVGL